VPLSYPHAHTNRLAFSHLPVPRITTHHTWTFPFWHWIRYSQGDLPTSALWFVCHYQSLSTDGQAQGPANSRQPRAFLHQAEPQRLTYTGISPCCSCQKLSFFDLLSGTKIQSFPCPPPRTLDLVLRERAWPHARLSLPHTHTYTYTHAHARGGGGSSKSLISLLRPLP
jgi:hypothetical protein